MSQFPKQGLQIVILLVMSSMTLAYADESSDMKLVHEQHMKGPGVTSSLADPIAALDSLDSRTPVPLLPHMANHQKRNMRSHLEAVQAIVTGLATKDFKSIEKAARSMGLTNEMKHMCEMMGLGAKGFSERAIEFHQSADRVADFAQKQDLNGVLKNLNLTLNRCTSCHATFKQQIVTQAKWDALSKSLGAPKK